MKIVDTAHQGVSKVSANTVSKCDKIGDQVKQMIKDLDMRIKHVAMCVTVPKRVD